jgi:hypothetical protein
MHSGKRVSVVFEFYITRAINNVDFFAVLNYVSARRYRKIELTGQSSTRSPLPSGLVAVGRLHDHVYCPSNR